MLLLPCSIGGGIGANLFLKPSFLLNDFAEMWEFIRKNLRFWLKFGIKLALMIGGGEGGPRRSENARVSYRYCRVYEDGEFGRSSVFSTWYPPRRIAINPRRSKLPPGFGLRQPSAALNAAKLARIRWNPAGGILSCARKSQIINSGERMACQFAAKVSAFFP